MSRMFVLILALTLVGYLIQGITAQRPFTDLRARFTPGDLSTGFYSIPTSTRSPLIQNYVQTPADPGFTLPVNFYCYPNDPRVCFMYDMNGNVAGVQISYLAADVSNVNPVPYNYSAVGGFQFTNLMNTPAYAFRAYFTNPANLTVAGRQNLNETVEGLWVYLDNQLIEVQRDSPKPTQTEISGFYRQGCFPRMGQHYFYRMTPDTPCDQLLPFYVVYHEGLAGFGIADFGRATDGPSRVWYERPPYQPVTQILLSRPACFENYYYTYGLYSLHVYFQENVWDFTCPTN